MPHASQIQLNEKIAEVNATIQTLRDLILIRDDTINCLEANNTSLHNKLKDAHKKLEQAGQYSRRENVIIASIAFTFAEIAGESHLPVEHSFVTVD